MSRATATCIALVSFLRFSFHFSLLDTRPFFFSFIGDLCKIPSGVFFWGILQGYGAILDESLTFEYLDGTNEDTSNVGHGVRLAICI